MSDYIALALIGGDQSARSAQPGAPMVDDGFDGSAHRPVRRSLAVTLRTAALVERRWADRLDPAAARG